MTPETTHIRYVLDYIDRGVRRLLHDDQTVRASARETGEVQERSAVQMIGAYTRTGQAALASAEEQRRAALDAAAATRASAEQSVAAMVSERHEARALMDSYIALARSSTASAEQRAAAEELAARAAVRAGIQIQRSNQAVARSHAEAAGAAAAHEREERGFVGGLGLMGGRNLAFASTAFLGGAVAGEQVREIVDASTEAQTAQTQLQLTVQRAGKSWREYGGDINDAIEREGALAGYTRGDLANSLAQFVRVNQGDVTKSIRDFSTAVDLARQRGYDLNRSTMLVMRAQLGVVGSLRRVGIQIQPVTRATDALRDSHAKVTAEVRTQAKEYDRLATGERAISALHRQTAGAAEKYGQTAAGAFSREQFAVEELRIALGRELLPEITRGVDFLTHWVDHLRESGNAERDMRGALKLINDVLAVTVPVLRDTMHIVGDVVGVFGGWRRVIEAIIAMRMANTLLGWASAFRRLTAATLIETLGMTRLAGAMRATAVAEGEVASAQLAMNLEGAAGGAVAATAKVGRLSTALQALGRIRVAPIIVTVVGLYEGIKNRRSINDFLRSHIPGLAASQDYFYQHSGSARSLDDALGGNPNTAQYNDTRAYMGQATDPRLARGGIGATPFGLSGTYGPLGGVLNARAYQQINQQLARGFLGAVPAQRMLRQALQGASGAERDTRITGLIRQFTDDAAHARDTVVQRVFYTRLLRQLPLADRAPLAKALAAAYANSQIDLRDKVDSTVWQQRLEGLPAGVRAAVEKALRVAQTKHAQRNVKAVLRVADATQRSIDAQQQAAEAELANTDTSSPGYYTAESGIQRAALGRLQQLRGQLQAALATAKQRTGHGSALVNQITQQLEDVQSQITEAASNVATNTQQAITAAVTQAQQRAQARIERIGTRLQAQQQIRGIDPSSAAGLRGEQRAAQQGLGILRGLRATTLAALGRASGGARTQVLQALDDVNNQITAAVGNIADLHRQRVRAQIDQAMAKATGRVTTAQGAATRYGLRLQLEGVTGDALSQAQGSYEQQHVVPAMRAALRAANANVRALRRSGATPDDILAAVAQRDDLKTQLLQEQVQIAQEIASNTQQMAQKLAGPLAYEFGGQLNTDLVGQFAGT